MTDFPVAHQALAGGSGKTDKVKEAQFHRAFTRAFTHWTFVERELQGIYTYLLSPKQPFVATAMYEAINTLRSKINMVHAGAHAILPLRPELLQRWVTLHNKIIRKSKYR